MVALASCLLLLGAGSAALANPAPTQYYYIPITADEVYQHYLDMNFGNGSSVAQSNIITIISMVASISNTVIYYDQWENGFDLDISNPTNTWSAGNTGGTQIWGDNNPANGIAPGYTQDIINAGTIIVLQTTNNSPRDSSIVSFDGGDKVASTKPITITEVLWPTADGALIAEGCEVYDTTLFGLNFFAPVGTNTVTGANPLTFGSSHFAVMASQNGTVVQVDTNGDGIFDVNNTLSEGQGWLVPGEISAGAQVMASLPVEVQELTGEFTDNYGNRWFTLYPQTFWSSDYYSPVSGQSLTNVTYPTTNSVFLYNSQTSWTCSQATYTTTVNTHTPSKKV